MGHRWVEHCFLEHAVTVARTDILETFTVPVAIDSVVGSLNTVPI